MRARLLTMTVLLLVSGWTSEGYGQAFTGLQSADQQPPETEVTAEHVPAADGGLGSTMTLAQVERARSAAPENTQRLLTVRPAAEPVPALAYRMWLPDYTLKPGSAQMRFFRALMLWQQESSEDRQKIELWAVEEGQPPEPGELTSTLARLQDVFDEIHLLATSEDMSWDHRLRDVRGLDMYSYLLPDVQESRSLARLLSLKIDSQLASGDVPGAVASLQDGFRLAGFVGQGETLVQQLVGLAIEGIMLDKVEQLIQLEDSPNLYWALATLPRPLVDINNSIQFELSSIHRVLPILTEAENEGHSEAYWNSAWAETLVQLKEIGAGDQSMNLAFAVVGIASAKTAKERLIAGGMDREKVQRMPAIRAVLLDASREIRTLSDELAKANYLPGALGYKILELEEDEFDDWVAENRYKSGAAAIVGLLVPAVHAAKSAGTRQEYLINRLMTIEALRMHAAAHDGQLPKRLEELDPVPALPNPYSGQPFDYRVEADSDAQLVILSADVPANLKQYFKEIRVRFED